MSLIESTVHRIPLNQLWYDHIASGRKLWEGRLKNKTSHYQVGDTLLFVRRKTGEELSMTISEIRDFVNYREALGVLVLEQVLPSVNSLEEGCNVYAQWDTEANQVLYGVRMIKLEPFQYQQTSETS